MTEHPQTTTATNGRRADPRQLPALLRDRDKQRLRDYQASLDFYNGSQWPNVTSAARRRIRRLTLNYVRAIVNKTASYVLKGATVGIRPLTDTDDATAAAVDAERALAEIADANSLSRLDQVTEIDTAVLGDGAFKTTWDVEEERVVITSPDVANLFPWPHPTDPNRLRRIAQRYRLPALDIFRFWGIRSREDPDQVIEDWTDDTLTVWVDQLPQFMSVNPYGLIPFNVFPNEQVPKRWNGISDVQPLMETAEELNSQATRISNILELSGNPIAILSGVEEAVNIEAIPGAVWTLPTGAKGDVLDLLRHGGINQHLDYMNAILRTLHDISETPRTAFGDNQRELSGIALEVELQPLLQKVDRKRLIRADAYRTRTGIALRLLDQFTGSNHLDAGDITVSWEPPTPQDTTRDITNEKALIESGLSTRRSSMARLNEADPDGEWQRWLDEETQIRTLDTTPAAE